MKSHQYASKRRLTNICCIVVGLAFVKLIFAGYLAAGGQLFTFTSIDKDSKEAQIAEAQAKRMLAYQEAALKYEDTQKALAIAAANAENSYAENTNQKNAQNSTSQNIGMRSRAEQNFALANQRLETQTKSRISFLPQSTNRADVSNQMNESVTTVNNSHAQEQNQFVAENNASMQNTSVRMQENFQNLAQNTETAVDRSDMVSDDYVLAGASSASANFARAQMRANLMQSMFDFDDSIDANSLTSLDESDSNYAQSANSQTGNTPQNIASLTETQSPVRTSFFSLVGTAHANEAYVRPDEATEIPIPSPKVQSYTSPDSLEYKRSELNRKEEELLALQQQMNSRLRELNELEGRIGTMVQDANSMQGEKFSHLIQIYTNMKARVAAQSLVTLDEDIAVRILSGMKNKQAGEIFSYMNPVQAARLSEAMSQFSL